MDIYLVTMQCHKQVKDHFLSHFLFQETNTRYTYTTSKQPITSIESQVIVLLTLAKRTAPDIACFRMGGLASIPCCGCRQSKEKSLKGSTQMESLPRRSQIEATPNASTNQVWEEGVTEPLPHSQESNQLSRADTNGFGVENDSIYGLSVSMDNRIPQNFAI